MDASSKGRYPFMERGWVKQFQILHRKMRTVVELDPAIRRNMLHIKPWTSRSMVPQQNILELCKIERLESTPTKLQAATVDTNGQIETTDNGAPANASNSLRNGPRGYNLLEDVSVRKKMLHFDRERAPERVVHALCHGAWGQFESMGDWSNITSACWLQSGAVSEVFTRFSVVVASTGGSEVGRDTHGFATKIYSQCGNQD
ncbi:uncharacterized protein Z519_05411 [Cladophialophora bantiana CBS 173.52]|uniref:catalase n=1 Tax=Cladophialophora bantiana (strain ATCC 10958 / CBS 173.52 / CDC B-1940 / NIH 8579) TaxID=1442370 RepID=A0A0D2HTD2_CLAB1|nr:uncharacterized protein Z519_05411 [Cladophialophora bantiana CBS 173.52]KIW94095.1 hypothetical protein Z519_05411 [Cladophialophora bantiana CBS 173.52]